MSAVSQDNKTPNLSRNEKLIFKQQPHLASAHAIALGSTDVCLWLAHISSQLQVLIEQTSHE